MTRLFGYIRPQKPELLMREFEQYRGVYCSLCKQLGKSYGIFSRMTLSYDCTFYAMLLMSHVDACPAFARGRCVANPMKACNYCGPREELELAAALSVIMTWYKLKDDLADGGFFKRLRSLCTMPFFARGHKKAAKKHPALEKAVTACMEGQRKAEAGASPGLDMCAEPTAQMLQAAFTYGVSRLQGVQDPTAPPVRLMAQLGYHLGRWVYFIDAADDLPDDLKEGGFNPFQVRFQLDSQAGEEALQAAREYSNGTLNQCLAQMSTALELMNLQAFSGILRNIVELGLPQMQKEILFSKEKKHVRSL